MFTFTKLIQMKYLNKMSARTVFFFTYMLFGFVVPIAIFAMKHDLAYVFFQLLIPVYYAMPGTQLMKLPYQVDWMFWATFAVGMIAAFAITLGRQKRNFTTTETL